MFKVFDVIECTVSDANRHNIAIFPKLLLEFIQVNHVWIIGRHRTHKVIAHFDFGSIIAHQSRYQANQNNEGQSELNNKVSNL